MSDFSVFANRTIKVAYNGETRRGNLAITPGASPSEAFSAIEAAVATLFTISPIPMVGYRITYHDEDGDLCTLTAHTVSDLALLATEGIVRLTLTPTSTSGNEGSTEANAGSSHMDTDAAAAGASASSTTEDAALRAKLQGLAQKIPQGMRMMLLSMAQGMDPVALHSLLGMALAQVEQSAEQNHESQEASEVLNTLHAMDPSAVHALALEVLRSEVDTNGQTGAASSRPEASNPLEAMLGAFLGGCGKGSCGGGSLAPNPMDFLGPLLAAKGLGKGGCTADAQAPNPMEALFGLLVAGKGAGKGSIPAAPTQPQAAVQQPRMVAAAIQEEVVVIAFEPYGPNMSHCQIGDRIQVLERDASGWIYCKNLSLGAISNSGWAPSWIVAGYAPSAPPATPSTAEGNGDADRAALEESVEDLLNMGLVTNRQTARELLTQFGDISSVAALVAE